MLLSKLATTMGRLLTYLVLSAHRLVTHFVINFVKIDFTAFGLEHHRIFHV